jgi:2-dehydropantoate 2-reductase
MSFRTPVAGDVVPVLGAGAIGCGVGSALHLGGRRPLLVSDWRAHVDAINANGLRIERPDGPPLTIPAQAMTTEELLASGQRYSLAYLTTKSQGTERSAKALQQVLEPNGAVVTLQNGINTDALAAVLGPERVLGGIAIFGAVRPGAGVVRRTGTTSWLVIGELDGSRSERVTSIAELTSHGGWETRISDNILGVLWSKVINNSIVNPLAVVGGWTVEELMLHPAARSVSLAMLVEGVAVARARGIKLEPLPSIDIAAAADEAPHDRAAAEERLIRFGKLFPGTRVSSLQDYDAGRPTELAWLTGHIVSEGKRFGVPTPCSEIVLQAALELERGRKRTPQFVADVLAKAQEHAA